MKESADTEILLAYRM